MIITMIIYLQEDNCTFRWVHSYLAFLALIIDFIVILEITLLHVTLNNMLGEQLLLSSCSNDDYIILKFWTNVVYRTEQSMGN